MKKKHGNFLDFSNKDERIAFISVTRIYWVIGFASRFSLYTVFFLVDGKKDKQDVNFRSAFEKWWLMDSSIWSICARKGEGVMFYNNV